ncbi:hypothetical protein [Streptosporangium sp. NPDC051022]|uniref:hypothetical protein n=1 Tax=Streptosporangium sp. NPDC051022 TaxID=3155752 RepID=UPI003449E56F
MLTFWIDHEDDRSRASDGVSRYGAYVRDRAVAFAEYWGEDGEGPDQVRFAVKAWEVATPPILTGYVQTHARVLGSRLERNSWEGALQGVVELAVPWPAQLAREERAWRGGGGFWRDWERTPFGGFHEPDEEQASRAPYLLTTSHLTFPIPLDGLPPAPAGPYDDVATIAAQTVDVLVGKLNAVVDPIIAQLEK